MRTTKPNNFRLWLDALRSETYKQGAGMLCNADSEYCCLGVACDVAMKNGVGVIVSYDRDGAARYNESGLFLPEAVADWLGLKDDKASHNPHVNYSEEFSDVGLSYLNDELMLEFGKIADILEREFLSAAVPAGS